MAKVSGDWNIHAARSETRTTVSNASRAMTVFEVLDYDSNTYVLVNDLRVQVVALIYKKVTISHIQQRRYTANNNNGDASFYKDSKLQSEPIWYMDASPASDHYTGTGTRNVEYILAYVVGNTRNSISLNTVSISVNSSREEDGTYAELIVGGGETFIRKQQSIFSVNGERLYGVTINCGEQFITYTYDVERYTGGFSSEDDSPANVEDYNAYWKKYKRVVGVIAYSGSRSAKEYSVEDFPDKVMAVNYQKITQKLIVKGV